MFTNKPEVIELDLSNEYKFMCENFVIATQSSTYLLLEQRNERIHAIKFLGATIRYGSPNDEGRGAHPLSEFSPLLYGCYEVKNSPWIKEQMIGNRQHPNHSDDLFFNKKHFIACFKDVMFEASCRDYELVELSKEQVTELVAYEIDELVE
ncbi:hypothetical protein [Vibrio parahaemolyticus]|uniref:hypothetical protein n=1 Tax=Vibrio parahaemolyticus TaxID=670 RepID=UPI000408E35B|nr:hypothetical protein [Vibrio parahaemolyticus]EHH1079231.1 hypothetical protein [Vibrio parahaemolyticus]MBM5170886.1 hypothetical protein [Vibrio parahaemolyticus]MCR9975910.1 hypothetical protein [Vibrio parahaemolyticus]MCS0054531.1 hypothetical protein [Vibrio parahaemolyticus]TOG33000.1 hypothetical protein CGJ03_23360 [Vibrio parahaemolyticus]